MPFLRALLYLSLFIPSLARSAPQTIYFGTYEAEKPSKVFARYRPILDFLEQALKAKNLDVEIELKVVPSYEEGLQALVKGEFDFAEVGATTYVLASEMQPKLRLLAVGSEGGSMGFPGVFVTRQKSGIKSLEDLKGHTFAFGDEQSTIGRYLSQAELLRHGIHQKDLTRTVYLGRHDKVANAVAAGEFDAGVVNVRTYREFKDHGLVAIKEFPNIARPWVASASLPKPIYEAIRDALLGLKEKSILGELKVDGFLPIQSRDFSLVKKGMTEAKKF